VHVGAHAALGRMTFGVDVGVDDAPVSRVVLSVSLPHCSISMGCSTAFKQIMPSQRHGSGNIHGLKGQILPNLYFLFDASLSAFPPHLH